jgi:hypothetical protein
MAIKINVLESAGGALAFGRLRVGLFADNSTGFAIAMLDLQTRVYSMQRRA